MIAPGANQWDATAIRVKVPLVDLDTRSLDERDRRTVPDDPGLTASRRGAIARRLILAVLVLIVIAGLTNQLGVRSDTVSASEGGLAVELQYADRARGGLAVPWNLTIRREDGFSGQVIVETDGPYLTALDLNAIHPEPAEMTGSGETVVWEYDPPPGEELVIQLDVRIEPSRQEPLEATTVVRAEGAEVRLEYRTWLAP